MSYIWGKGIKSSGLTKKQINRKINEMKKRGYVVPQNIREQLTFSKKDTLKSLEKRIASKSDFEYTVYKKMGKGMKTTKGIIGGKEAYQLETLTKEYNAKVQRLQNLKQYKGKNLAWTKFDIRNRNLGNPESVKEFKKRLKKSPSQIAAFEEKKKSLPWDNLMKSIDKGPFSKDVGNILKKSMEDMGYKKAALDWKKGDTSNKFAKLIGQESKKITTAKGVRTMWIMYASDYDVTWGTAATDVMWDLIDESGLPVADFFRKYGPKDKDSRKKLIEELGLLTNSFSTTNIGDILND